MPRRCPEPNVVHDGGTVTRPGTDLRRASRMVARWSLDRHFGHRARRRTPRPVPGLYRNRREAPIDAGLTAGSATRLPRSHQMGHDWRSFVSELRHQRNLSVAAVANRRSGWSPHGSDGIEALFDESGLECFWKRSPVLFWRPVYRPPALSSPCLGRCRFRTVSTELAETPDSTVFTVNRETTRVLYGRGVLRS